MTQPTTTSPPRSTLPLPRGRSLSLHRPVIMGILNVTPDSFSDGGRFANPHDAITHARSMLGQGAQIIDVGGESTRPGAQRVGSQQQIDRVAPVIRGLCQQTPGVIVSIDTTLAPVAQAAIDAGASMINDISAGRDDPNIFSVAANHNAPIVLTHMQGSPQSMQDDPQYDDVVTQVEAFLVERAQAAVHTGVRRSQILIDPGIGFGKTVDHNLALLGHLDRLVATGLPVLLGASRKRFIETVCQLGSSTALPPTDRVGATCATTALGVAAGVAVFRVHDVQPNRQAADLAWALRR